MKNFLRLTAILAISAGFCGCWFAAVGGAGAEVGYTAGQKDRSAGETIDDQLLYTKVKAALIGASGVSSGKIDITARKGLVILKGVVSSNEEKNKALAAARDVKGVVKVEDKLFISK